jgi:hypothetical protein
MSSQCSFAVDNYTQATVGIDAIFLAVFVVIFIVWFAIRRVHIKVQSILKWYFYGLGLAVIIL